MVLGLRSKKGTPVSLVFDIVVQEVKPWPSKSLSSSSSIVIQWQRGEKRSGCTRWAVVEKDRIVFNDTIRIPATLYKVGDNKKNGKPKFNKKCIVFSLFETHSDRATPKGQPLGRAVLDFADYGSLDRPATSSIAVAAAKREYSALGSPSLIFTIAPAKAGTPPLATTTAMVARRASSVSSTSSGTKPAAENNESRDSIIAALVSDEEEDGILPFSDDEQDGASTPSSERGSVKPQASPSSDVGRTGAGTPPPAASSKAGPVPDMATSDAKSERVQRILSSVALASPAKTAAAAAASAYASKKALSSRASSSSELEMSDEGSPPPPTIMLPAISKKSSSPTPPSPSPAAAPAEAKVQAAEDIQKEKAVPKFSATPREEVNKSGIKAEEKEKAAPKFPVTPREEVKKSDIKPEEKEKAVTKVPSTPREEVKKPDIKPELRKADVKQDTKPDVSVLQAARMKYAEGAGERTEKLDKKAVEEARLRAANAEARAAAADERSRLLQLEMENLKAELRDAAALEVALYSVVAQHGSSPQKIHSPARRLARAYLHACKYLSPERRASTARNCASGLVIVARACENDVSRLTFWWSNVVVFRGMILQAFAADGDGPALERKVSQKGNLSGISSEWSETQTLTSTLERIEAWIFGRIVESIWWQSLTPHMQASTLEQQSPPPSPTTNGDVSVVTRLKKSVRGLITPDFADSRQGSHSIDLWKSAFTDALQRLCPVRAGGHECGCLKAATKLIIEQCVARLDVAMFNAILRDTEEENIPTDPVSDPISDLSALPISPNGISFSGGAQLKNAISTWSTWLLSQTTDGEVADAQEVLDKGSPYFTLLRAMSDLLMLPKDMLMDKSVRKEVCPALSLMLIRRILCKFVPDEFSPDPVPPSLLAALNAEISMERQRVGEADISSDTVVMASAPPVIYFPPDAASLVADVSPDATSRIGNGAANLSRNASLLRKGHTSDDELEEIESPLFLLVDNGGGSIDDESAAATGHPPMKDATAKRYNLVREAWTLQP